MKIYWTHTAIAQRNSIFDFWDRNNHSTTYSNKLRQKIIERLQILKRFPRHGKKSEYKQHRFIPMGNYSLYYLIKEDAIYITAFWDNRQDPKKLLNILNSN